MKIGIIGGSGLDKPDILQNFEEKEWDTPYGKPASSLVCGEINGVSVVVLARHGKEHSFNPTLVPYRANIWALKEIGCTHILATTACGSLREEIVPGDFVFLDQFVDFTKHRLLTFYEDKVVHTPMAYPFDASLRQSLITAATNLDIKYHATGTMLTIEGPRFSTKAESDLFRLWGQDVINMSTVPEVILANELNLHYASVAMVTDYDCWNDNEVAVTYDLILERMEQNSAKVKKLLVETISHLL